MKNNPQEFWLYVAKPTILAAGADNCPCHEWSINWSSVFKKHIFCLTSLVSQFCESLCRFITIIIKDLMKIKAILANLDFLWLYIFPSRAGSRPSSARVGTNYFAYIAD